ncbi:Ff.00g059270.m01.CDS01 [Fusarium sp. VM40]|nr:Ff.00g059270.m01.CDS01 [Fusarium sp. VM40]
MTIKEMLMTRWVPSREKREILTAQEYLNNVELVCMLDLARLEKIVIGSPSILTINDWHRFSGKIFRHWDTSLDTKENENLTFYESLPAEHSVKVGSTTNLSSVSVYAYLTIISVVVEPNRLNLSWNDCMGRYIAHTDIKFDCSMEECLNLAIPQYDHSVADRVNRYNERAIIATARRRIVNFPRQGTESAPFLHTWDKVPPIKPLIFAAINPDQRWNLIRNTVEQLRRPQKLGAKMSSL